ncbi:MAG: protoglobin domain-containing protein [Acidobacteriota bacterium]|jgi:hypothetical protein
MTTSSIQSATRPAIPGYTYGQAGTPRSPISLLELEDLKKSLLFGHDDIQWLRKARPILEPQTETILDVWYGFVGSNPHLLKYFVDTRSGEPDAAYLAAVRKRFGQWIVDTADANYDQAWLDYQYEIGLRHHRVKKNKTDGAHAAAHIPLRHVLALVFPISATIRPFLEKGGQPPADVEAMQAAWTKAVLLQAILWAQPYVREGDF